MTDVKVRSEPLTYEREAPRSWFRDIALSRGQGPEAAPARARLERHEREMETLQAIRAAKRGAEVAQLEALGFTFEYRTPPNRTQGQGGYFTVPLWVNQQFATAPRAKRVLAALMPGFPLPAGVGSVNLPRETTGPSEAPQADNQAVSETDELDAAVTAGVATIAGNSDWPLQSLEQSPAGAYLDWAMFKTLTEAYDAQVETQLITGTGGTGTAAQVLGVTNVTGTNAVTFTNGSPTLSLMYPFLGQASAAIGKTRKLPPECWLMTTSRWSWIATSEDSQSRPITTPDTSLVPPSPVNDGLRAIGSLSGRWPVYLTDVIPTTLGTGANQDEILCLRPSDMILLESDPFTSVFPEVLSGTMQVRFSLRGYVAAFTSRYPTGISVVGGTGFVVQSGF